MGWAEGFMAALSWIIFYLVMELRQETLIAFVYADAPLILLGLILYLRVRRQRRKKEKKIMWGRKSAADELFDTLVEVVQKPLQVAEEAVPMIDYALAELPDIDGEGEIRRARDVLASSSKELRQQLNVAVGPSTIRGVKKCVERIWDAIDKTEDIRIRAKLIKDAHAFAVAGAVANFRATSEGFRQIKGSYEEGLVATGLAGVDQLGDESWAHAYSRLAMVSTGVLYGTAAGIENVSHPALEGMELLPHQPSLPRPKVEIVDDEDEDRPEGEYSDNGTYHSHPMDRLRDE